MTIKQLIEELQRYEPHVEVVVETTESNGGAWISKIKNVRSDLKQLVLEAK
jgi:hypothetical protein